MKLNFAVKIFALGLSIGIGLGIGFVDLIELLCAHRITLIASLSLSLFNCGQFVWDKITGRNRDLNLVSYIFDSKF
ncbi:hypothetical protein [Shewanella spartinae]|uniref:hypothetical protein n=1 Tax=Shewanella spartinae TaxID=2864205 RepID=UPI001C6577D7|nr:hypothetical protein [Shewanella spartinae]QYJ95596.1 hypothetical protein K0I31_09680 [Shewanella spartinae]